MSKPDNFFFYFPYRNIHFSSVFQVTMCHESINEVNDSPTYIPQHFMLLRRMAIFPVLLRD